MSDNKQPSVLRSLDWWTIGIYLALLAFGWISVCGASYTYGDNEIVWIGSLSQDSSSALSAADDIAHSLVKSFTKELSKLQRK